MLKGIPAIAVSEQPTILMRYRYLLMVGFVLCMGGAFTLTHIPGGDIPDVRMSDKSMHMIGFAGLGTALLTTLMGFGVRRRWRVLIVAACLGAYGIIDENTQPYFSVVCGIIDKNVHPDFARGCESLDWMADMCGMSIVLTTWEYALAAFESPRHEPGCLHRLTFYTLLTAFILIVFGLAVYFTGSVIRDSLIGTHQYWSDRLTTLGLYCLILTLTNAACLIMLSLRAHANRWFILLGATIIIGLAYVFTEVTAGSILATMAPLVAFPLMGVLGRPKR